MENEHEEIIEKIVKNIKKSDKKIKIKSPFKYNLINKKNEEREIDILSIVKNDLCLFEVKSGSKEESAKKQLIFHKKQLLNLKYILFLRQEIIFSEIKLFSVSGRDNIIENIETQEQMAFDPTFLENPLEFLNK